MKYLQLSGLCLLLSAICAITSSAQNMIPVNEPDKTKPELFTNLPDKIPVDLVTLQNLLNTETGKDISFKLGLNTASNFDGRVVSKADDNSFHSVVIHSGNFNGATLTLSSSTQPNGAVRFTGRIISFKHSDLYILQNQNAQYILIKKNFYDLINE
jgi:hypothetical protein